MEANATDAIILLESKDCSFFILCGKVVVYIEGVIDDEWKGRRMSQHVCNRCAVCTDKGDIEVDCGLKYDILPSFANTSNFIPPPSTVPSHKPPDETAVFFVILA
jgi:hypothetical protein